MNSIRSYKTLFELYVDSVGWPAPASVSRDGCGEKKLGVSIDTDAGEKLGISVDTDAEEKLGVSIEDTPTKLT